ncbi:MAG: hypothetical protein AABX33_06755 [Nanoarchaeota archaeon]
MSETAKKFKGKGYFFIDSVSTMLIHNNHQTLARFIHSILVKMRLNNVSGILISIEEETDREIRAELIQMCDKVIKV